jgi:hypothetical protein
MLVCSDLVSMDKGCRKEQPWLFFMEAQVCRKEQPWLLFTKAQVDSSDRVKAKRTGKCRGGRRNE